MHSGSKAILVIEARTENLSAGLRVPKTLLFAERQCRLRKLNFFACLASPVFLAKRENH